MQTQASQQQERPVHLKDGQLGELHFDSWWHRNWILFVWMGKILHFLIALLYLSIIIFGCVQRVPALSEIWNFWVGLQASSSSHSPHAPWGSRVKNLKTAYLQRCRCYDGCQNMLLGMNEMKWMKWRSYRLSKFPFAKGVLTSFDITVNNDLAVENSRLSCCVRYWSVAGLWFGSSALFNHRWTYLFFVSDLTCTIGNLGLQELNRENRF